MKPPRTSRRAPKVACVLCSCVVFSIWYILQSFFLFFLFLLGKPPKSNFLIQYSNLFYYTAISNSSLLLYRLRTDISYCLSLIGFANSQVVLKPQKLQAIPGIGGNSFASTFFIISSSTIFIISSIFGSLT